MLALGDVGGSLIVPPPYTQAADREDPVTHITLPSLIFKQTNLKALSVAFIFVLLGLPTTFTNCACPLRMLAGL